MSEFLQNSDSLLIRDRIHALVASTPEGETPRARAARHAEARRLKEQIDAAFADSRGWILAKSPFTLEALKRGATTRRDGDWGINEYPELDHVEYFREPARPYRPAGVITHAYTTPDAVIACARSHGLQCEVLPWSWHYPGACVAAVLTRRAGTEVAA